MRQVQGYGSGENRMPNMRLRMAPFAPPLTKEQVRPTGGRLSGDEGFVDIRIVRASKPP